VASAEASSLCHSQLIDASASSPTIPITLLYTAMSGDDANTFTISTQPLSEDGAPAESGLPVKHAGEFTIAFEEDAKDISKQELKTLLTNKNSCPTDQPAKQEEAESWLSKAVRCYTDNYILLILTAALGVATNVTCIKILSRNVSVFQITAIRSSFCTVFLLFTCWWRGISLIHPLQKFPLFLMRGILGAVAFLCLALGTFELPLSDSSFISNSYPVVTAVMSWLFGMEDLGALSWLGVCGCFVGNALVAHPPFLFGGHEHWGPHRFIGVVSAASGNLFMASTFILIRYLGKGVNSMVLTTYMHLFSLLFSLPFVFTGTPMPLNTRHSPLELVCYAGTCLMGICLQLASTRALQIGPPTKVTSIFMLNMLLSGAVGVVFLSEKMSMISGIGAAVIVVSVVLVTAQKPKKPAPEPYQIISTVDEIDECVLSECTDEQSKSDLESELDLESQLDLDSQVDIESQLDLESQVDLESQDDIESLEDFS